MPTTTKVRVRFAPSPTGELHLGSARTALYNFLFARHHGGQLILRVEDTDQARYVEGAMDRFLADLKWLGMRWDEGPDVGGPHAPYVQSERSVHYQQVAEQLVQAGQAYRCFCSPERLADMRAEQIQRKQPPRYDRLCHRELTAEQREARREEPHVVRFLIPQGETTFEDLVRGTICVNNATLDDLVLLKSDGLPTYHLANVVDDHLMNISHVIRGEEWLPSTPKHVLLYQALGWQPPAFAHLPLLLAKDKKKFSKRVHGEAVWVATYRVQGYLPEALVNYLALLGWNPGDEREVFTLDELIQEFSLERVHKAGAIFDLEKLNYLNVQRIRKATDERLISWLRDDGFLSAQLQGLDDYQLAKWVQLARERMTVLADFNRLTEPLVTLGDYPAERLIFKKSDLEQTKLGLQKAEGLLQNASESAWGSIETMQEILEKVVVARAKTKLSKGDVFWPVRVALSGLDASPSPAELFWALGRDESLKRLQNALNLLG